MQLSQGLKLKCPQYAKRYEKVIFQHDNARSHVAKRHQRQFGSVSMGCPTPPTVFTRYCSFRLPLASVDDSWPGTSFLTKKAKTELILGSPQKTKSILNTESVCYLEDG